VLLKPVTDYASTTGTSVVLTTGASADDVVEMIVYDSFAVADTVSAANGGTFSGAVSFGAGASVTGALTTTAGATIAGGDLLLDDGSPEIIFQTGSSHYNWMVAAQENVSNALEISSGGQDGDYTDDTWTPRFVVNSDGNISVGIASPVQNSGWGKCIHLHDGSTVGSHIRFTDNTTGSPTGNGFIVGTYGTDNYVYGYEAGNMIFGTNNTERMRLDTNGALLVHTSSRTGTSNFVVASDTSVENPVSVVSTEGGSTQRYAVIFYRNSSTMVGSIQITNSGTAYVTSSDYRLKENVTDITDATDRLKQLNPVKFNFISDADTTLDGFLAHEVQSIVPEAVTGTKDETEKYTDEDGKEQTRIVPQGIDQAKLVPLLVKTIQELEARIAALESS